MTHPHPNRRLVPKAVLTKSGKINIAGASVNTSVRPVNTVGSKPTVNHPRPISNAYKKGYSQVKDTTAKDRAVVSENKGKGVNTVKASACWGNPQQKEYKEKGVIDSGCSRHMTGNKCYLTEYEDYDGGYDTLEMNGVAKRRNRTLIEAATTMLVDSKLPTTFCDEVVNTVFYVLNRVLVIKPHNKAPYELIRGRTPFIDFMKPFRCPVTILNTRSKDSKKKIATLLCESSEEDVSGDLDKDGRMIKLQEGVCLFERFSPFKNAFTLPSVSNVTLMDDTGIFGNAYDDEDVGADADLNKLETTMNVSPIPTTRIQKDHPKDQIIREFNSAIQTRRMTKISDEHAMKVWTLVSLPNSKRAIGTKWVFRSEKGERGCMRNGKTGLHKAIPKEEGIDYDEVLLWFQVTPKMSHLHAVKRIFRYLKGQPKLGLWYPRDSPFDLEAFSDSDYARASLDRKSTTGGCQFLGKRLISWQCKKQTIVANSTTEAEYVAAANCYGQVLWIQNQMLDYGFNFMNTKIFIDNESTICIVKNPVFHSKTKHIEIRHHFIRDCYEKKLIQVIKIHTDHNVADLLTKAFDVSSVERDITTVASLVAAQDSDNILKTQSTAMSNDPLSQEISSEVNTSGCGEDSMEYHDDLIDFVPPTPRDSPLSRGSKDCSRQNDHQIEIEAAAAQKLCEVNWKTRVSDEKGVATADQHKNFKEVQKLYEREKKWIDDFKPIDDDSQQQAESTKKRPRADSEEESFKKQKLEGDNDAEKEELRDSMDVVPMDDVLLIADGSSKNYKIFSEMLDDFNRKDMIDLHRLGDMKTLFEPNEEDEIWKNQQDYNLISWRLFDSCGVRVLLMNTGVSIHMMILTEISLTQENAFKDVYIEG
ncbi:putative ribonuclease H-like domain-containing protein [Tanacetum coccineum]